MLNGTINRRSKVPYYQQLYEILREEVRRGSWKPGDLMPSEAELIETYQVSRNTVRDVLEMLVNEGYIYRERGRGTFIAKPKVEQTLVQIINFTEDMRRRGIVPSSRVLESELIPAPEEIAQELRVPVNEELGLLVRLRLGNDEPMSVEESYVVHRFCRGYLDRHDYGQYSLRKALADDYNMIWSHAVQTIRSVNASAHLAQTLQVRARAALLQIERVTFSDADVPVEYLRTYYRGDRYSLVSELRG